MLAELAAANAAYATISKFIANGLIKIWKCREHADYNHPQIFLTILRLKKTIAGLRPMISKIDTVRINRLAWHRERA